MGEIVQQDFSSNSFSFSSVFTYIELLAQLIFPHAYVRYGMCKPRPKSPMVLGTAWLGTAPSLAPSLASLCSPNPLQAFQMA